MRLIWREIMVFPPEKWRGQGPLSWHNYGFAVDLDENYWKIISRNFWMPYSRLNQGLNHYGLTLPLNSVDGTVYEWWHLGN